MVELEKSISKKKNGKGELAEPTDSMPLPKPLNTKRKNSESRWIIGCAQIIGPLSRREGQLWGNRRKLSTHFPLL